MEKYKVTLQPILRDGPPGSKKNEIKPWRQVGWVIPPAGSVEFVAAMERVLDVYRRPYDGTNPIVCMDETPRQLIRETRTPLPPCPGRLQRHDYEYERCGVYNVFMATEPLAGTRMTKVTERKTKIDWPSSFRRLPSVTLMLSRSRWSWTT